ncbi:MAG: hypothetical protein R2822_28935 [Spirosomataceae bacterium]
MLDLRVFQSGLLIRLGDDFSVMSNPFKETSQVFKTLLSFVGNLSDKLKVLQLSNEVSKESSDAFFQEAATDTLTHLQQYGWSEAMIANFLLNLFLEGYF